MGGWGEVRVCVSVHMHVFICEWMHLHVCVEAKADDMSLPQCLLCLLKQGLSVELGAH